MSTQLSLFDEEESKRVTEEAIEEVAEGTDLDWYEEALSIVYETAKQNETFASDDVWEAGLEKPREPSALGPIMRTAAKNGWIVPTPQFRAARIPIMHRKQMRIWRSLIYGPA